MGNWYTAHPLSARLPFQWLAGSEGKFGFIEFRTIAEATSCMALNNIELGGKQLRVERPRDYAPMPDAMLEEVRVFSTFSDVGGCSYLPS